MCTSCIICYHVTHIVDINSDGVWFLLFAFPISLFILLHDVLDLFSDNICISLQSFFLSFLLFFLTLYCTGYNMFDFRTTAGFATNIKALLMCTRFSYSCSYPVIILCSSGNM